MENGISVVINTFNAQKYLSRVLESVRGFDEIVLCDMESTDKTIDIARQYDCYIVNIPKGNIKIVEPIREYSIHLAHYPWVLVVDADELVTGELREYLYKHINSNTPANGIMIPRRNQMMGKFMHGYYPDYNLRFFKKDCTHWPSAIHSQPNVDGNIIRISRHHKELALNHLDDRSIKERLSKINLYTEYEISKRAQRTYGYMALFYRPIGRFLKCYLLKSGFKDGLPGLLFAILEAVQQYVILAKYFENKIKNSKSY